MSEERGGKKFDLEDRTFEFAKRVRAFVKRLPRTICNVEDVKQLVRSSGSVGANYLEANEALSKKTFSCEFESAGKRPRIRAIGFACSKSARSLLSSKNAPL